MCQHNNTSIHSDQSLPPACRSFVAIGHRLSDSVKPPIFPVPVPVVIMFMFHLELEGVMRMRMRGEGGGGGG
eukprot:scaffold130438_cov26-Tisochrysis_lutea.AAC.1